MNAGEAKNEYKGQRRYTILICEDDRSVAETLELTLNQMGYSTVVAEDGTRGLELLRQVKVDVVVTDLNMVPTRGETLIEQMGKDPLLQKLPVIIVSADQHAHLVPRARKAISKPFSVDELLEAVEEAIRSRHLADPLY